MEKEALSLSKKILMYHKAKNHFKCLIDKSYTLDLISMEYKISKESAKKILKEIDLLLEDQTKFMEGLKEFVKERYGLTYATRIDNSLRKHMMYRNIVTINDIVSLIYSKTRIDGIGKTYRKVIKEYIEEKDIMEKYIEEKYVTKNVIDHSTDVDTIQFIVSKRKDNKISMVDGIIYELPEKPVLDLIDRVEEDIREHGFVDFESAILTRIYRDPTGWPTAGDLVILDEELIAKKDRLYLGFMIHYTKNILTSIDGIGLGKIGKIH